MEENNLPSFISSQIKRGNYLILEQEADSGSSCTVDCAGWEDCAPGYQVIRSHFRYQALEYIAGGLWELQTMSGKWTLQPGSVFCYGPNSGYSLKAVSVKGLSKYFVDFSDKDGMDVFEGIGLTPGKPGTILQHRWLRDLFDQLIEIRTFSPDCQSTLSSLTLSLMLERMREELRHGERKSQAWLSFERCRSYLLENYINISNLSEAASSCGVSPAYMSRLFNRFSNESPKEFLVRMKMNHAAERMLRSNVPMQAAAAEVGYEDVFHFSRVFKKCFGKAPSHFIQRSRE